MFIVSYLVTSVVNQLSKLSVFFNQSCLLLIGCPGLLLAVCCCPGLLSPCEGCVPVLSLSHILALTPVQGINPISFSRTADWQTVAVCCFGRQHQTVSLPAVVPHTGGTRSQRHLNLLLGSGLDALISVEMSTCLLSKERRGSG